MSDEHNHDQGPANSLGRWAFIGFLLVGGFFLLTEHRAHVFGILPYLLLAACPLMHIFGHGHGGHGGSHGNPDNAQQTGAKSAAPTGHQHH